MREDQTDRISASSFSRAFEQMCNFVAVAKTGDPQATLRGLITLCLIEFPETHFESPGCFSKK